MISTVNQAAHRGGQGSQHLANIRATYKFTSGTLKNLDSGADGNYASRYKVINNSKTGVFYSPSYALIILVRFTVYIKLSVISPFLNS